MSIKEIISHKSIEAVILKYGCILFSLEATFYGFLWIYNPALFKKLIAMIGAVIVGGRVPAILVGLELELNQFTIILFLFIYNFIILMVIYPLMVLFHKNVFKGKFLGNIMNSTRKKAETKKNKIMKFGLAGLFVFVWFPFPWSGSIVGSTIGYLMGIPTRITLLTVVPAMLIGTISWTMGFRSFFILTESPGKLIALSLIAVVLLASLLSRLRRK